MYKQFLNRVAERRENVYIDKQLRSSSFKTTKKQSLPLLPSQIIQIWQMETYTDLSLLSYSNLKIK